jgi:dTDP-4-dehydrorhamnose 3,5-epimerase
VTTLKRVADLAAARTAVERALIREAGPSPLPGVELRALRINRDPRGTLTELLRSDWPDVFGDDLPFAQAYASVTAPGIARDDDRWHVHRLQTDRFLCLSGRIVVPIADARPDSPTRGKLVLIELAASADAPAPLLVTVPPGTLHGLIATSAEPAMLLNFPTRLYDASDEGRVPFADAGIELAAALPFSYDLLRAYYGV